MQGQFQQMAKVADVVPEVAPAAEPAVATPPEKSASVLEIRECRPDYSQDIPWQWRLIARKHLAIELHQDNADFVFLQMAGKFGKALKFGTLACDLATGDPQKRAEHLMQQLPRFARKRSNLTSISFCSPAIRVQKISLPKIAEKGDMDKAVSLWLETELPDIEGGYDWFYQPLEEKAGEGTGQQACIVTIIPSRVVSETMSLINGQKLEARRLVPAPAHLQAAYLGMVPQPRKDLLVNVSATLTQIAAFDGRQLYHYREVPFGISHAGSKSALRNTAPAILVDHTLRLTPANEESLSGKLQERLRELRAGSASSTARLTAEIWRSRGYFKQAGIERIVLTGHAGCLVDLVESVEKRLQLPVLIIKPDFGEAQARGEANSDTFFSAIGPLLCKGKESNLLPKGRRRHYVFHQLNQWLWIGFSLLLLTLFMLNGITVDLSEPHDLLKQNHTENLQHATVGQEYRSLLGEISTFNSRTDLLDSQIKQAPPYAKLLRMLSNETPAPIRLRQINITELSKLNPLQREQQGIQPDEQYELRLSGSVWDEKLLAELTLVKFVKRLEGLHCFRRINIEEKITNSRLGSLEFSLVAYF